MTLYRQSVPVVFCQVLSFGTLSQTLAFHSISNCYYYPVVPIYGKSTRDGYLGQKPIYHRSLREGKVIFGIYNFGYTLIR